MKKNVLILNLGVLDYVVIGVVASIIWAHNKKAKKQNETVVIINNTPKDTNRTEERA